MSMRDLESFRRQVDELRRLSAKLKNGVGGASFDVDELYVIYQVFSKIKFKERSKQKIANSITSKLEIFYG